MEDNGKAMVLASFVADSLALGAHWIYSTDRLKQDYGRVDRLLKPPADSYHPAKDVGEFTHYGDQTFVLLQSVASQKRFNPDDYSTRWKDLFKDYEGYYDQATKATLEHLSADTRPLSAGSSSNDLSGSSRIAPLVFCYRDELETLVEACRVQTGMTHNVRVVMDCAEFFARVSWMVLKGESPAICMEEVSKRSFKASPISDWVKAGIESKSEESVPTVVRFGQSCHADHAFPGVVHLIARYEDNLEEALVQSVMAGGDSAARGMAVGMVLGAHLGDESIPERWLSGLKRRDEVLELLGRIHESSSKI